ncbi:uncharacterized protein LOC119370542 [Jatropha curcas]|uniref:uncharacterized protein LOC119370542 n=1 Tax=Jatropha curcas TaxID=180498 RepID=UPI0018955D93|nr:uncharacterized protein LOC119370542 [Jatropha curcas]
MAIVNQMRAYGEQISDETIVAKVLRSLTTKFDHVMLATEEAKDLLVLSIDELMGSLQAHQLRINRSSEKNEEKALQVTEIATNQRENVCSVSRGRGRGGFRSSHGRGNSRGYGHIKADCWYKDQKMNLAAENEEEEEERLFMACIDTNPKLSDLWFVDSGCSNHMIGTKSLFQELNETQRIKVQLGNAKDMQVEGKGTVKVETSHGKQEIPIEVSPDEKTRVNSYAPTSASTATQILSNSSTSASPDNNSSVEESSDETPLGKYKSLADINASCQLALTILDLIFYEEQLKKKSGRKPWWKSC